LADAPLPLTRDPRAGAQNPTSPRRRRGEVAGRAANSFTLANLPNVVFVPRSAFSGYTSKG